ncbi:LOW QUALITY PROTEIN: glutaredoxin domain-containing cysteine-rich protein CG12206-like [Thrips palmi]|uniref:LOW QUALITY PROTEIN: glutaredoxin domain-containing cysteine-rich protein CG12206-like n=1 Tax=Thrips palmi TaxID=161013 RepID=A0A6P8YUT8_THRPL|nr:LOW QUALITY PROTEIN: glutaredoxin domain-containing cysteine-rich protein CG12206-like [Thrips palmi]
METLSVSIPPPLPPKTRKKTSSPSWCGSQLQPLQQSQRGPRSPCRGPPTEAAPGAQCGHHTAHSAHGAADRVHVVSIRIRPEESRSADGCVRISVGGAPSPPPAAMVVTRSASSAPSGPSADAAFLFYNGVASTTSGQASPVDSGTCSDDAADRHATPPPLPRKTTKRGAAATATCVRVTVNGESDEERSDRGSSTMSCDSLNSLDKVACFLLDANAAANAVRIPDVAKLSLAASPDTSLDSAASSAADGDVLEAGDHEPVVVRSIRKAARAAVVDQRTYEDRQCTSSGSSGVATPPDHYYDFHLNEREDHDGANGRDDEDTFAGCRDYTLDEPVTVPATIRSSKGTVRGVRNRVRAGVATFLSIQHNRSWKDKEAGKVVVYTTTMGVVRATYQRCVRVKQILRTLLVRFDEKDVFMSREVQGELMERMRLDAIQVPQVFVEGQHVGDAETVERLNESGELRKMLKPYKSADVCTTCEVCGGYRMLPCAVCNGSKKSVHRNNFTAELVALRCMNCDEAGLVKCDAC